MKEDLVKLDEDADIPVYLFTGFLESGKTKFIQETLEDKRFDSGERTLLIVCEEGEEEYDPQQFACRRVMVRYIEDEESLTQELLMQWEMELGVERVLIEYNGMWMLDTLYQSMPQRWVVYQEFMFADAGTFISYNDNMRQLVFDKLRSCELIVLNRFPENADIMPYHKIVRGVNRSCDIAYERPDGKVRYDDIEDPLPFDKEAAIIEIADRDYAIWYRDLNEELGSYNGKTVRFKGQIALSDELPQDSFIIGRQMMNCCAADIAFAALIAEGASRGGMENGDWMLITAKIAVKNHPGYDRKGPVLTVLELSQAQPAAESVATFY